MIDIKNDEVIYEARLHWILFFLPMFLFVIAIWLGYAIKSLYMLSLGFILLAVFWEVLVWLTYQCSYLIIKRNQVLLSTGIFVRQTIVISLSKIESIDIRQSILGTIFQYGSLIITGTGGTRQVVNFLSKPLTCRRYIEQMLHA